MRAPASVQSPAWAGGATDDKPECLSEQVVGHGLGICKLMPSYPIRERVDDDGELLDGHRELELEVRGRRGNQA